MCPTVRNRPPRAPSTPAGLSARAAEVLREVVDCYLRSGEPVGSQLVAGQSGGMSSATARVVLGELMEHGLLAQPHTSAGRVPTERGLRVYIEALLRPRQPSPRARDRIDSALRGAGNSPEAIVRAASERLSETCELASLVRRPRLEALHIKGLSLVALGPSRLLAVVVFDDDSLRHRVVELEYAQSDLVRVQNLFQAELSGLTLAAARARIQTELSDADAHTRALTESALPEGETPDEAVFVFGRTHIVERAPSAESIGDMLRILDDKRLLLRLLDDLTAADGVQVRLGCETSSLGLTACTLVAAPYLVGSEPAGTLAIVGPVRMEYARVIPLVTYTARAISGILRGATVAA